MPFGSGATIFYNYVDLRLKNNTPYTFQINLWFTDKCIEGELRCDQGLDFSYHVYEKNHRFIKSGNDFYRENEIWRNKISKFDGGKVLKTELLIKNHSLVKYKPENIGICDKTVDFSNL